MPENPYMDLGASNPYMDVAKDNPYMEHAQSVMPPTFGAVPEKDGSVSLIPTLDESGKSLSPEEAETQYRKTGNRFGSYPSIGDAQKAGQALYTRQLTAPMMSSHGPASGPPPAVKPNMLYIPGQAAPMPIGNEKWKQYAAAILNPLGQVPAETVHALSGAIQGVHAFSQKHPVISQVAAEMFPGTAGFLSPAAQAIQEKTGAIAGAQKAGQMAGEVSSELEPSQTGPKVANFIAKMPLEMGKFIASGPGAPLVMGIEGYGNTYLAAKAKGASDDKAQAAAATAGGVNTAFGMVPEIGPKAQSLAQLFFQKTARGFVLGTGMEGGNLAAQWIYDPEGAKAAAKDPNTWIQAVGTMLPYELAGGVHKIPEVRARAAEAKTPVIERAAPEVPAERTPDMIRQEALMALRRGDTERASALRDELTRATAPKPTIHPAFREATPEEAARAGKYEPLRREDITPDVERAAQEAMHNGPTSPSNVLAEPSRTDGLRPDATGTAYISPDGEQGASPADTITGTMQPKLAKRGELESNLTGQQDTVDALNQRRQQLLSDIQSADEQAQQAGRKRGPEGRRIAQKTADGLRQELADVENQITLNTGKSPEEMGWSNTKQAWDNLKAEMQKPGGQRGAIGPNVDQMGGADIPGKVAELIAAGMKDGHRNASEWLASMRDKMEPEDFDALYRAVGGVKGANTQWQNNERSSAMMDKPFTSRETGETFPLQTEVNGDQVTTVGNRKGIAPADRPSATISINPDGSLHLDGIDNKGVAGTGNEMFRKTVLAALNNGGDESGVIHAEATPEAREMLSRYKGFKDDGRIVEVPTDSVLGNKQNPEKMKFASAGLNPFEAVRDMAEAAKRELGLPEGATDADLGREVMSRIGRLGSSVKETVVRIMSKVKGIGRDMAQALAEHFHQAVSGTRESQIGAIGPNIKDAYRAGKLTPDEVDPNRFPRVDEKEISVGPGGTYRPKAIEKPLYRETNVEGLNDLLYYDKSWMPHGGMFVSDNPDIAIGQGINKGVHVEFRPASLGGYEHAKPGTGDLAGREYRADSIAPRAVQSIVFDRTPKGLRGIVARILKEEFVKEELPRGRVKYTRDVLNDKWAESQRGAIGEKPQYSPEEEAHYQSHIKEARDLISEFLPGDENKAARSEAYRNLPSKASVISDYRRANAPAAPVSEPAPKYNRLEGFAKSAFQPIADAPRVARALATGDNQATNRVWNLLQERDVLPKEYEQGSLETPKIVRPLIFGEDQPKITKDFKQNILGSGAKATFDRFMRSPHNLEEGVFGKYNTPTQDLQMAVVSAMHNRNNLSSYFRDLLRTTDVKDNSVEMQAEAKPLFERFQKVASELDPLQKQREALEKNLKSAEKKGDPTSARQALADWDAQNGQRYAEAQAQMDSIQNAHQKMLRDFASKYGDARVALASEYAPDKVPAWINLSPGEKTAADGMRNTMRSIKGQLDRVGIPTREEDYVTHLTKYLAPETGGQAFAGRTPREILKFAPRAEDSTQWLPSVHAAVSDYIPNVTRKLATQEFYNKWRSMIDDKDPNSLSNPASPNYAPNASIYLKDMFKTLDTPDSINFFDRAVNKLRDYENMKLLAANIRVGWKHAAGKLPSILAQHDIWTAPGALGQVKAMVGKLSESNPIRTAVDKLGGNTVDWAKKADLVSYFANTREILGMLRENPFTSGVEEIRKLGPAGAGSNKVIRSIFGDRAQDAVARINRGIQKITSNPVAAVEAWENGLDLLTSIEKGHAKGLGDEQNVKAFLNNILDFNFRGGADSPRLIKDPKTRYFVQFAQTPMKLAELKAKLIMNAVRGGTDIYGTDHTANLVKHVAMAWLAFGVAKQMGVNVKDSILHLPFLNSDQWGRMAKMAYYGTKANLLNDPKARRQFNDTKAAFIGEKMPAVMGSPVFDIMRDVETGLSTGPSGIIKQMPIYNQMKAILTDKPPKGFDNVGAYLTGERSERSKKQMEQKAIQAGRRQIRYEQKLERSR